LILNARNRTANEIAAQNLGLENFQSEAEIAVRPCGCTRVDPDVCECFAWLQAARAAPERVPIHEGAIKTIGGVERALSDMAREMTRARGARTVPRRLRLWSMLFLAPRGNELAQDTLAQILRPRPSSPMNHDDTIPTGEIIFQDRRYITLLYAAFAAHPDHAAGNAPKTILRWRLAGAAATESARLVDWFCANHPAQALRIARDLRLKMRKQGWRV
jgi:hypothetical protein